MTHPRATRPLLLASSIELSTNVASTAADLVQVRKSAEGTLVRMSVDTDHRADIIERLVEMLGSDSNGQEQVHHSWTH